MALVVPISPPAGAASIRFSDQFDILTHQPLAEYAMPGTDAFAVEDRRSVGHSLFALIVEPQQPINSPLLGALMRLKSPDILTPIARGPITLPITGQRRLAILFERPAGGRLCDGITLPKWTEDDLVRRLLVPILDSLRALAVETIAHRGIRPDNIFFRDPARRQAMLGDCVTAPPAFYQPIAYETVESAMTDPIGRGIGRLADDLYALGVVCLALVTGEHPGQGLNGAELLDEKLKKGSFGALVGDRRVPVAMIELLRGLLLDDTSERWGISEVESWIDGRRLSPKLPGSTSRAARPFVLDGQKYFTMRSLAMGLAAQGTEAAAILRSHTLDVWITRSLGDKKLAASLAKVVAETDDGSSTHQEARALSQILMVLDPGAPIRYRGLALAPDGIATALARALLVNGDVKTLAEIISANLPQYWFSCQAPHLMRPTDVALGRDYDRLRRILADPTPGMGLERVGYELSPDLPCLSPAIAGELVISLDDLLAALERAVAARRVETMPIDRHVAAFLAHRLRPLDTNLLMLLKGSDQAAQLIVTLHLLARLQGDYGPSATPALARLLAGKADVVIKRLKHHPTRDLVKQGLAPIMAHGDLTALATHLDNADLRNRDAHRFATARQHLNALDRAIADCAAERQRLPDEARHLGHTIAAGIALLLVILVAGFSLLIQGIQP